MMKAIKLPDFTADNAQPFFLEGGDHAVLLIHGFTGSSGHMRVIGNELNEAGFTVRGITLPGHGQDLDAMAKSNWKEWLQAARDAYADLRKRYKHVSVAGLSMGGCISLILAEEEHPTCVMPISAPMGVKFKGMALAGVVALVKPVVMWGSDPERPYALDAAYDYGYPGFPTRKGLDFARVMKQSLKNLHQVTCPLLVVQSHDDETVTPESSDLIYNGVSSTDKQQLWLDDVPHVCTISKEHSNIARAMIGLMKRAEQNEQ